VLSRVAMARTTPQRQRPDSLSNITVKAALCTRRHPLLCVDTQSMNASTARLCMDTTLLCMNTNLLRMDTTLLCMDLNLLCTDTTMLWMDTTLLCMDTTQHNSALYGHDPERLPERLHHLFPCLLFPVGNPWLTSYMRRLPRVCMQAHCVHGKSNAHAPQR